MKRHLYLFFPLLLLSCTQNHKQAQKQIQNQPFIDSTTITSSAQPIDTTVEVQDSIENRNVTYHAIKGRAILVGKNISLLDSSLESSRSLKEGEVVQLKGLSDSLFKNTDDNCDAFHYVKVSTRVGSGIIDGRNVYKISGSYIDTSFHFKNKTFTLKSTAFYGINYADEDGLTFCSKYHEPIVIIDSATNTPKLIELMQNRFSKKANRPFDFDYLEIRVDDGAYEKIKSIQPTDKGVDLTLKCEYQEGWNTIKIELLLDGPKYTSEFLDYGKVKYAEDTITN